MTSKVKHTQFTLLVRVNFLLMILHDKLDNVLSILLVKPKKARRDY